MPDNKHLRFLLSLFYIALAVFGGYFFIKNLLGLFMPFIIAYLLSRIIEPMVQALNSRLKVPRGFACAICTLLVTFIFGLLLYLVLSIVISEVADFTKVIPSFLSTLPGKFSAFVNRALSGLSSEYRERIIALFSTLISDISVPPSTYTGILDGIRKAATSVPTVIITIVATIVSTYFFASGRDDVSEFLRKQLPKKWIEAYMRLKVHLFGVLGRWLKAQLILLSITWAELSIAFIIFRIPYAGFIAVLIALIDALPVFGVGTVLIPWGVIMMLSGDLKMGLSLIILYGIVILVRNSIEPKIVGQQIGLPPLITLMAIYLGFRLFGFLGMFLFPLIIIVLIR
ncbi:MAG: sporulation integral membrane protein YtvI, partial [Clostridiales bacterium]|nr:sporulation integral membrane protein YtvI [Clostridiales bacterium]